MKEFELKYGCNPNQKPAKFNMEAGSELPVKILSGSTRNYNYLDAFNGWQLVSNLKKATGLPAANVLLYKLDNGETVVVRPSGTEQKIKIYYTTLGKNLEEAEAEKEKLAEALKPIMA